MCASHFKAISCQLRYGIIPYYLAKSIVEGCLLVLRAQTLASAVHAACTCLEV